MAGTYHGQPVGDDVPPTVRSPDAAEIFGRMTAAQRLDLIGLYERWPWPAELPVAERIGGFSQAGLLAEAAGPNGTRLWRLTALGYRVLGHALEWRDGFDRLRAVGGQG
jgi:hypothetical protein